MLVGKTKEFRHIWRQKFTTDFVLYFPEAESIDQSCPVRTKVCSTKEIFYIYIKYVQFICVYIYIHVYIFELAWSFKKQLRSQKYMSRPGIHDSLTSFKNTS